MCLPNPPQQGFVDKYRFYLILITAFLAVQIPFISIPLNWLETFFHEISHGLTAMLTGGSIVQIQLFANGSGLCTTRGGSAFFISFMGYAGATFWGAMLYVIASYHNKLATGLVAVLCCLLSVTLIFWVRDLLTFFICLILLGIFIVGYRLHRYNYLQYVMQFFGIVVVLNAVRSPLFLIDGKPFGDGAALAKITFIPEFLWVLIWFVLGVAILFLLGKKR